jgi:hypothetical protein
MNLEKLDQRLINYESKLFRRMPLNKIIFYHSLLVGDYSNQIDLNFILFYLNF